MADPTSAPARLSVDEIVAADGHGPVSFPDGIVVQGTASTQLATTAFVQSAILAAVGVTLDLTAGANGEVAADPAGPVYLPGTVVTVTATPANGYDFDGWTVDAEDGGDDNPLLITMDTDHTVAAAFAVPVMRTLTLGSMTHGSATLSPIGGSYPEWTVVTVTPVPDDGYEFDGWTVDGVAAGFGPTRNVVMGADHTVVAAFIPAIDLSGYLVFDNFNRANGALGTARTGQAWVYASGQPSYAAVANGVLRPYTSRPFIDAGAEDVSVTVANVTGAHGLHLYFRANLTTGDMASVYELFNDDAQSLFITLPALYDGTEHSAVGYALNPFEHTWVPGDVVNVTAIGVVVTVSINGTEVASHDFTSDFPGGNPVPITGGTYVGLSDESTTGIRYDDVAVVAAS